MPREGFYRADQGKALSCRPCPGPHPGSQKVEMTHTQFAELDKHNSFDRMQFHCRQDCLSLSSLWMEQVLPEMLAENRAERIGIAAPTCASVWKYAGILPSFRR